jgi:hypothetical protein
MPLVELEAWVGTVATARIVAAAAEITTTRPSAVMRLFCRVMLGPLRSTVQVSPDLPSVSCGCMAILGAAA